MAKLCRNSLQIYSLTTVMESRYERSNFHFNFFIFSISTLRKIHHKTRMCAPIGQFHVRKSILLDLLIAVVQPLDAVVSHKNVQKPLGNGQPWTQNLLSHRILWKYLSF